ncbi:SSU ribosomal protein S20P [Desulforamulus reducens MI-1]|uniref:Small ribosomal subunit protein bS20 n=1 Tax=Desulforamulus reducens (strain ATCC BAA-1160 / DSM 100696 / MI-1) TaxID=349161 RepID=RS20_DESRM|nr:30S ribosomal protein S20 [Desulforamulus reducens]A4J7G2.1 RecName: Full=Small ribosomal subunit protein bS20; AltName: Full=30S ribosomal protein S20 [Desulforamulus reducens MI-1]ABO51015.1 SSU ribosomal protein S20P [Desulforamulus reducens MI-1]
MPNIKSAIKRVEITKARTIRNASIKSAVKTAIRRYEEALAKADKEVAETALRNAMVAVDKAVTKGVLHKNAAARKKSRLTKRFNKIAG